MVLVVGGILITFANPQPWTSVEGELRERMASDSSLQSYKTYQRALNTGGDMGGWIVFRKIKEVIVHKQC